MNREAIRERLASSGITSDNVTRDQIMILRKILRLKLKESGIYEGSAKLKKIDRNFKYMTIETASWDKREAISFNRDGFIGVAGWADNKNVQPMLLAISEWIDLIRSK